MAKLEGKDDKEKLANLNKKTYAEQAQWFMNIYWKKLFGDEKSRLHVWEACHLFNELDSAKGKLGNELNEFDAHRFMEKFHSALTVLEMRAKLKSIDIDFNKRMSITEYLVVELKQDWHFLVNGKMGEATGEMEKAQKMLDEAQKALHLAISRTEAAEKAEKDQIAAENELKRALQALQDEEDAFKKQVLTLETTANDMSKGVVTRNKANNELAQLKAKDPLPLQKAKINQSAAVRKAEKATANATEMRLQAEKAQEAASQAFAAAEKYMDECSKIVGSAEGSMWWMSHELQESKKYLPQSKGGVRK